LYPCSLSPCMSNVGVVNVTSETWIPARSHALTPRLSTCVPRITQRCAGPVWHQLLLKPTLTIVPRCTTPSVVGCRAASVRPSGADRHRRSQCLRSQACTGGRLRPLCGTVPTLACADGAAAAGAATRAGAHAGGNGREPKGGGVTGTVANAVEGVVAPGDAPGSRMKGVAAAASLADVTPSGTPAVGAVEILKRLASAW